MEKENNLGESMQEIYFGFTALQFLTDFEKIFYDEINDFIEIAKNRTDTAKEKSDIDVYKIEEDQVKAVLRPERQKIENFLKKFAFEVNRIFEVPPNAIKFDIQEDNTDELEKENGKLIQEIIKEKMFIKKCDTELNILKQVIKPKVDVVMKAYRNITQHNSREMFSLKDTETYLNFLEDEKNAIYLQSALADKN